MVDLNKDMVAAIIHRGRDHGLPTYSEVRTTCGFEPVRSFSDLNNTIDPYNINMLKQAYKVCCVKWFYTRCFT